MGKKARERQNREIVGFIDFLGEISYNPGHSFFILNFKQPVNSMTRVIFLVGAILVIAYALATFLMYAWEPWRILKKIGTLFRVFFPERKEYVFVPVQAN